MGKAVVVDETGKGLGKSRSPTHDLSLILIKKNTGYFVPLPRPH
jgi:hypothetical protein